MKRSTSISLLLFLSAFLFQNSPLLANGALSLNAPLLSNAPFALSAVERVNLECCFSAEERVISDDGTFNIPFPEQLRSQPRLIPEGGRFATRLLVVIDSLNFERVAPEVMAYKQVLEKEGLGVAVLVGTWATPDEVKEEIIKVYREYPVMEGAVFMGDIPVVRIRNFQHATTAFKMNEKAFPIEESSVTSDRFYDDLDLEFEFLQVDENNPRHFYYKLKEGSPQMIASDFYSARMMPPSDMGVDTHDLLRRYLRKVVEAHQEVNWGDNIKFFNGHGYNYDCLTVWQNQQFVLREQFPEAFRSSRGNAFYNFRQDPFMKYHLFERLQSPGTDLFVFHEHGAIDTQYINGGYPAPNMLGMSSQGTIGPMEALSISLRNRYRALSGERLEVFVENSVKEYHLTPDFFAPELLDSTRVADSTFAADINIVLSDLRELKPQPRITIFDACYNGSFHKPGYVAGYHIFADGGTVVTQGNTVNVLQDKWSMELIGMLAEGARIGFWQKEIQTLESHLIGDPTYRLIPGGISAGLNPSDFSDPAHQLISGGFSAETNPGNCGIPAHLAMSGGNDRDGIQQSDALNRKLVLGRNHCEAWLPYLESDNPNYQSIALKMLSYDPPANYPELLLQTLKESPYASVRMQALQRILYSSGKYLTEALLIGLEDPYELIRRNAARFAGYSGDERLIAPLAHTLLFSNESQRVQYAAQSSLEMFDFEKVQGELSRQAVGSHLPDATNTAERVISYFASQKERYGNYLTVMQDKTAKASERISAIRFLRNNNNHLQVSELLELLADNSDDTEVRVVLAEALGWFRWSVKKEQIINALEELREDPSIPKVLSDEITQTLIRLT